MDPCKCQVQKTRRPDETCEESLYRRLLRRRRNQGAVAEVWQCYRAELEQAAYAVLAARRRSSCNVDDLVSQFLAQLLERPRIVLFGYDPAKGRLGPYLRQAAYWRMQDYLDSRAVSWPSRTMGASAEDIDPPELPSDGEARAERTAALAEALHRLDKHSRWLLQVRFGIDSFTKPQSLRKIAAQLHISSSQVSRRIETILERLRGELS